MRTLNLFGRCMLATVLALSACTRQPSIDQDQPDLNLTSYNAADSADQSAAAATGADQSGDPVTMNSWDFDGSGAASSDDSVTNSRTVSAASSSKVWLGMSGTPDGCMLTNYRNVDDARIVMEQRGAKILEQTSDMVIMVETSPKGQLKSVFATDQGVCSALVAQRGFSETQDAATTSREDGPAK